MHHRRSHHSANMQVRAATGGGLAARAGLAVLSHAVLSLAALFQAVPARGHDAPTGWTYPFSCCSNYDCRAVPTRHVSERPEGYVINVTGEVVAYNDTRVRNSPDGEFHWCSVSGESNSRTICLFVPPRAY